MASAGDVISRCTRNGAIQWGQVAKQLGVSVDKARRMYDPVSSARHDPQQLGEWAMPKEVDAALLPDAEAYKSPHVKGDGLKAMILVLLGRQNLSSEVLASMCSSTPSSIRSRLSQLQRENKVYSDDEFPRTWGIVEAGGARKIYGASAYSPQITAYGGGYFEEGADTILKVSTGTARMRSYLPKDPAVSEVETEPTSHRGEAHANAKLSEAQVRAIRLEYWGGRKTQEQLAIHHGLSTAVVGRVIRRQAWKDVT